MTYRVEVAAVDRRDHDGGHAGGGRALDRRVPVGVELGRIQVAVGVDQHQA